MSEVVEHFLEKNDFQPFPEIIISVLNVFFPQEQIKSSKLASKLTEMISTEIIFGLLRNHFRVQLIISKVEVNDFSHK